MERNIFHQFQGGWCTKLMLQRMLCWQGSMSAYTGVNVLLHMSYYNSAETRYLPRQGPI